MVPRAVASRAPHVDVAAAMEEQPRNRAVSLKVLTERAAAREPAAVDDDPFAEIEV